MKNDKFHIYLSDAERTQVIQTLTKPYSVEERTYIVSSNNKAFQPGMGGYSIYGSSLDGSDVCCRLDGYMANEHGGENGWKIERC